MNITNTAPDLTQRPPRSPRVRLGGYVLLPRILDKGRASLAGKLGEYRYSGKGIDRHFFGFVGLDHESLTQEIAKGGGDGELLEWIHANAKNKRQPWEIAAWSQYHLSRTPDSDYETLTEFADSVRKFSATREDVTTWFDLLDLDDHCTFGGKA
ncbi:MAG TPA: DUF5069 domain-containing protein [Verrucomicrobiota bacterium]|nr:DUF5069 domain-containing protein [Verrucomicrobiales bacterium]HRI14694.1 DUF5069 domain-containing protein [Verrucomicrobiota bacterium]